MNTLVVVGAQWGDEGKGKVVDSLAASFDVVARYQGGHNAGHTVVVDGRKVILQLIPCGILRPDKWAVIGNGVVLDPTALLKELDALAGLGIRAEGRLFISNRAHLIFPFHRELETAAESARGEQRIGTTSRGIGPAYEDKMGRHGLRVGDLLDSEAFGKKLFRLLEDKTRIAERVFGRKLADCDPLVKQYQGYAERLTPFISDVSVLLAEARASGKRILCEGAQGTMLDVDHGTYPYVTSSSATAGGASTGLGLPPTAIDAVLGVTKAYTTRVGSGPFATEARGAEAETLRERGDEYGAVTGRPRRCGWLDLMVLRYSARLNGLASLAVTKMDVLDHLAEIPVCVGYRYRGSAIKEIPAEADRLAEVEPIYETRPGWQTSTRGLTAYDQLPPRARDYLKFVGDSLGLEIGFISTGPERKETIIVPDSQFASWLNRRG
ncbi:MAG: adenylosuccinate synthase [Acidobacteria bacterium]|nr:adenylosuccinate synthase [Acidobacteriota bacterium]